MDLRRPSPSQHHPADAAPVSPADPPVNPFEYQALLARGVHPSVAEWVCGFAYGHLPPHLQEVSKPFGDLALWLAVTIPSCPQLVESAKGLMRAKDDAVRAKLRPSLIGMTTPSDIPPRS